MPELAPVARYLFFAIFKKHALLHFLVRMKELSFFDCKCGFSSPNCTYCQLESLVVKDDSDKLGSINCIEGPGRCKKLR